MNQGPLSTFADEFTEHWLPRAPRAGDVKGSHPWSARKSRDVALTLPYIEANPTAVRSLIVTDHDGSDADLIAALKGLPAPSYVAMNPHTRAGHIVYALDAPVCLTDAARRRPINLLARVESGLTTVLDGDLAYGTGTGSQLTKNPFHHDHLPLWGDAGTAYGLRDLAAALDGLGALPRSGEPRKVLTNSLVGRNVALFDITRQWAYRAWRRYAHDQAEWDAVTHAYAWDRNLAVIGTEFTRGPLDDTEALHLARSVSRWTWRKFWHQGGPTTYDARLSTMQKARGQRNTGKTKTVTDRLRAANRAHGFQTSDAGKAAREGLLS